jgi:hypothetical protein
LIEAGYEPVDVYATMIKVGLNFAKDQANDNPETTRRVIHHAPPPPPIHVTRVVHYGYGHYGHGPYGGWRGAYWRGGWGHRPHVGHHGWGYGPHLRHYGMRRGIYW